MKQGTELTEDEARAIVSPYTPRSPYGSLRAGYCCASVADGGRSVDFHQCSRKVVIEYGVLGYCRQHDPAAIRAKKEEDERRMAKEAAARRRRERIAAFRVQAGNLVVAIANGHNDPVTLARDLFDAYADVLGENADG